MSLSTIILYFSPSMYVCTVQAEFFFFFENWLKCVNPSLTHFLSLRLIFKFYIYGLESQRGKNLGFIHEKSLWSSPLRGGHLSNHSNGRALVWSLLRKDRHRSFMVQKLTFQSLSLLRPVVGSLFRPVTCSLFGPVGTPSTASTRRLLFDGFIGPHRTVNSWTVQHVFRCIKNFKVVFIWWNNFLYLLFDNNRLLSCKMSRENGGIKDIKTLLLLRSPENWALVSSSSERQRSYYGGNKMWGRRKEGEFFT